MYRLKGRVLGHSGDVRCLTVIDSNKFLTGSRDTSCKIFCRDDETKEFLNTHQLTNDNKYVSCCETYVIDGNRYFIVGTGFSVMYVYNENYELMYTLEGHSNNVSCIDISNRKNHIASGSWDSTIKIWDIKNSYNLITTLYGHEMSVWCVRFIKGFDLLLSGSADKTIRLWKNYVYVKSFNGHSQPVRDILILEDKRRFLSCSNDMTIIKWDIITGSLIKVIGDHDNFIYSLEMLDNDKFISTGEDGRLVIWGNDSKIQEIHIPCSSIWCVKNLNANDFIVGCSDGCVRIYTNDLAFKDIIDDKPCDSTLATDIDHYHEPLSNVPTSKDKIINAKALEDDPNIPDISIGLAVSGTSDGEITLVRNNGKVQVFEWKSTENMWKPFGDVITDKKTILNGENHSTKVHFEGKEYDYVFDVDLEGSKMLKLPYNYGEDEWEVAEKFLSKHSLSSFYTEQVVNFIKSNVKQQSPPKPIINSNDLVHFHKFSAVNMGGLFKHLSEAISACSIDTIPKADIISLKIEVNKIVSVQNKSIDQHSIIDMEKFPWETVNKLIDEFDGDKAIPFLDLLRVLSLDSKFTKKFIDNDQLDKIFYRFLIGSDMLKEVPVMLVLKTLCNMFSYCNEDSCSNLVDFFVQHPKYLSFLNNSQLWSLSRCQIAASTFIFNFFIFFRYFFNKFLSTDDTSLHDLFHLIVEHWVNAFNLSNFQLKEESLLRLMMALKLIVGTSAELLILNQEKCMIKVILTKYVKTEADTNCCNNIPTLSSVIVELNKKFN